MNSLNSTTQFKKLSVVVIIFSISCFISNPVLAQTNPRPSIFNEPPYNRSRNYRPKYKPKRKPNARIKKPERSFRDRKPSNSRAPIYIPGKLPTYEFRAQ